MAKAIAREGLKLTPIDKEIIIPTTILAKNYLKIHKPVRYIFLYTFRKSFVFVAQQY